MSVPHGTLQYQTFINTHADSELDRLFENLWKTGRETKILSRFEYVFMVQNEATDKAINNFFSFP